MSPGPNSSPGPNASPGPNLSSGPNLSPAPNLSRHAPRPRRGPAMSVGQRGPRRRRRLRGGGGSGDEQLRGERWPARRGDGRPAAEPAEQLPAQHTRAPAAPSAVAGGRAPASCAAVPRAVLCRMCLHSSPLPCRGSCGRASCPWTHFRDQAKQAPRAAGCPRDNRQRQPAEAAHGGAELLGIRRGGAAFCYARSAGHDPSAWPTTSTSTCAL